MSISDYFHIITSDESALAPAPALLDKVLNILWVNVIVLLKGAPHGLIWCKVSFRFLFHCRTSGLGSARQFSMKSVVSGDQVHFQLPLVTISF